MVKMGDDGPSERRTAKKLQDCLSWRGEDFTVRRRGGSSVGTGAKRLTRRARRRHDRAVERAARSEA